ncbi:hypothetical protein RvY_12404-2 [Ramazzottius varieornatus]|uniref:Tudor-knot domain-containing protein n=1 Tax=Ramazzottius varieornatus TaxID=947166 RepID=A0A1D1VJE2_RAMVA|nr:hypothetical protein RvY_12404-2 [Ramazzottius varieornatus]
MILRSFDTCRDLRNQKPSSSQVAAWNIPSHCADNHCLSVEWKQRVVLFHSAMDKTSTCSAPSHGGIPPPIMTINPAPSTPNRNMKKELNDHAEMRLEDFMKKFSVGDDVWVISKGQWHEAKIILIETYKYPGDETTSVPIYRIHYPDWGKRYDEWMYNDSLMLQNTENNAKASAENGALMEASGIKSMKTGKRTAQADKTSSLQMTAKKARVFQSSNPVPINGVFPSRGRGKGGSRGGATAEPRGNFKKFYL